MFKDFYFANPSASYFLVLSFAIILILAVSLNRRKRCLESFEASSSLQSLLFLERRTLLRYILLITVCFLATFALMQPEKVLPAKLLADGAREVVEEKLVANADNEKVITKRRFCDVIFLLDASASMNVEDTRQKCSRLDAAKEIIDEMISQMDGQNVALYTFTSVLTPVVPPTLDYFFTRLMLKDISFNYGDIAGTDLFEALDSISIKHFQSSPEKQKVLVLLTDGGDTDLERLGKDDREKQLQVMLKKIKQYENQNIRIFTVGLGSPEGTIIPEIEFEGAPVISSLDTDLLIKLGQEGRGQYFFANDYSAIALSENILKVIRSENSYVEGEEIPQKKLERTIVENNAQNAEKKTLFQLPLALAIIALGFEMMMPLLPARKKVEL